MKNIDLHKDLNFQHQTLSVMRMPGLKGVVFTPQLDAAPVTPPTSIRHMIFRR